MFGVNGHQKNRKMSRTERLVCVVIMINVPTLAASITHLWYLIGHHTHFLYLPKLNAGASCSLTYPAGHFISTNYSLERLNRHYVHIFVLAELIIYFPVLYQKHLRKYVFSWVILELTSVIFVASGGDFSFSSSSSSSLGRLARKGSTLSAIHAATCSKDRRYSRPSED